MRSNRSIPDAQVIPEIPYADVGAAAEWLAQAFGFELRLRIANHRIQMAVGEGAIALTEAGSAQGRSTVLVRIEGLDGHCARALAHGARIVREPADHVFGERQYTAEDFAGHRWTFSETIADINPAEWGGELN